MTSFNVAKHVIMLLVIIGGGTLISRVYGACGEIPSASSSACASNLELCGDDDCTATSSNTCSSYTVRGEDDESTDDDTVFTVNTKDKLLDNNTAPRSCTITGANAEDRCVFDYRECKQRSPCYRVTVNDACDYADDVCDGPDSVAYYFADDDDCAVAE